MSLDLSGVVEMKRRLQAMKDADKLTQAAGRGLFGLGNRIITAAKLETPVGGPPYSPNDPHPGLLRASEYAAAPLIEGTRVSVTLGAGGGASDYAKAQHENTKFRHHVGKAQFIKDPFDQLAPGGLADVRDEIAAHLKGESA